MSNAFLDAMGKLGYNPATSTGDSPRSKLIYQADKMLDKLKACKKTEDLNYDDSNTLWWAGKASGGKRVIQMYYASRKVGDSRVEVDDSLDAVTKAIKEIRLKVLDNLPEEFFDNEEKRRKEESASRTKK
jgi:hypothetical protein